VKSERKTDEEKGGEREKETPLFSMGVEEEKFKVR